MANNTKLERINGAKAFVKKWQGRGKEDEDYTEFWNDLLSKIYGVENPWECIKKQGKVVIEGHHKRIDLYVKLSKVVIEQKSFGVDLNKKRKQSIDEYLMEKEHRKKQFVNSTRKK